MPYSSRATRFIILGTSYLNPFLGLGTVNLAVAVLSA